MRAKTSAQSWVGPLVIALIYGMSAAGAMALTRGAEGIATLWPPSGILLAALLRSRGVAIWRTIILCAVSSLLANLHSGNSAAISIGFTIANMVESCLGAWMLRRWCATAPSFIDPLHVARFCVAAVVAALVSASLAGVASGFAIPGLPVSWLTTVVLGILIVTPTVLTVAGLIDGEDLRMNRTGREVALLLLVVFAVAVGAFSQSTYPMLFLPMAALLAATYRLGPLGASGGVLIIAIVGTALTGMGSGPVALVTGDHANNALFLQFYLLVTFATALPLAALLTARMRLTAQVALSENMYRLLAANSNDMIVRIGLDGVRRYVSPASMALLGYTPEELVGATPAAAIHPDDRARAIAVCRSLLTGIADPICTYRQQRKDGSYAWLEATYRLVRDPLTGLPEEFIASVRDVSRREAAELAAAETSARLHETNRLLTMAEKAAQVGHWRLDAASGDVFWSPEVYRMHGRALDDPPNLASALECYHPDDQADVAKIVNVSLKHGGTFEFAKRIIRSDGAVRHIISRGQAELGPDGSVTGAFGVIRDVTEQMERDADLSAARERAEALAAEARTLAETDELTGLASRRKSLHQLNHELAEARTSGRTLSLAIFDVDHFKSVNDRHGHAMGDQVLMRLAKLAQFAVRGGDLVGRLGGEEFLILMPGADNATAATLSERVRHAIEGDRAADDRLPRVTISVGVATMSEASSGSSLLNDADRALYEAKRGGRNQIRLAA